MFEFLSQNEQIVCPGLSVVAIAIIVLICLRRDLAKISRANAISKKADEVIEYSQRIPHFQRDREGNWHQVN